MFCSLKKECRWMNANDRKIFLLLCLLVASPVLTGCDLLKTRDPQPPSANSTVYPPALTSDALISNFEQSFNDLNATAYVQVFSDSSQTATPYTFTATTEAASVTTIFHGWDVTAEKRFFENFTARIRQGFGASLQLTNSQTTQSSSSRLIYQASYKLTATYTTTNLPAIVGGQIQLTLEQNAQGIWHVVQWTDYQNGFDYTISDLKRLLYN
jgi:hypothetical protein